MIFNLVSSFFPTSSASGRDSVTSEAAAAGGGEEARILSAANSIGAVSAGARIELSPSSTGSGWVSALEAAVCSVAISATTPTGSLLLCQ